MRHETGIDCDRESAERRVAWIQTALSDVGASDLGLGTYHDEKRGYWNVMYPPTRMARQAMRLVMIREGRPDLLACDDCIEAQPGHVYIKAAQVCHHLDYMAGA